MSGRGLLVSIDGPGGAGKSTLARLAADQLTAAGIQTLATAEPSTGPIGVLARGHTHELGGLALACLVAADRYHHLDTQVRPALATGTVVICDRYTPSSHVLQALDGVDPDFIQLLNRHADLPDLAVLLTCNLDTLHQRLSDRGSHGRFEDTPGISHAETARYQHVADQLTASGIQVLGLDSTIEPPELLAARLVARVQALRSLTQQ
ncbi:hypothetical protein GCM10010191_14780 [Actinomadura vinacea]|uniref:Thymidylate kinase n=1 Tax=Actinomadura vinacea TaxID=115336 RepID=A0ABN3ILC9_9ACTN